MDGQVLERTRLGVVGEPDGLEPVFSEQAAPARARTKRPQPGEGIRRLAWIERDGLGRNGDWTWLRRYPDRLNETHG